mmetsp:Transcript_14172/g.24195  ORF Transcript_14172/g.24195 Transcript_14172/m.24195 type:complete len:101 (+) Transcript_14172:968-1270(+)
MARQMQPWHLRRLAMRLSSRLSGYHGSSNPVDNGPEDSDRSSSPSICSIDGSNYEREREQEGNDEDSDLEEDELESHVKAGKREAVMAAASQFEGLEGGR